jgi:hypothetical protein
MAKTAIGEPIPVGDLSSRTDLALDTAKEETPTVAIDALRSDILSAETSSTIADAAQTALSAAESAVGST